MGTRERCAIGLSNTVAIQKYPVFRKPHDMQTQNSAARILGKLICQNTTGCSMVRKYNVLFLCRANSARSIMAEALLRELGGERFHAFSAGIEPAADVHPMTLEQLRPTIASPGKLRPKSWDQFVGPSAPEMDVVIAMCDEVGESYAPAFSGAPTFCEWSFADPLAVDGTDRERKRAFEQVFRQILRRISLFVALPLHSMRPLEQRAAVNAMDEHAPPTISADTPALPPQGH